MSEWVILDISGKRAHKACVSAHNSVFDCGLDLSYDCGDPACGMSRAYNGPVVDRAPIEREVSGLIATAPDMVCFEVRGFDVWGWRSSSPEDRLDTLGKLRIVDLRKLSEQLSVAHAEYSERLRAYYAAHGS